MNEQKKQKLLEKYDDAAFALLMDEYAEEEGARLMAEFEAAQAAGQVPEMPAELDEQCRRMIRRDRAKKRGIRTARSFRKVAVKAAVAVLVFIGLITTVVMSVDALRVPVLNYIVEHFEKYSSIDFNNESDKETPGSNINHLPNLIPAGYSEVTNNNHDGLISAMYENKAGNYILFSMTSATGEFWFDTENATYENVMLGNYSAILIREERLQMIWLDEDIQIIYNFVSDGLDEETFWSICESLASLYGSNDNPTTNYPSVTLFESIIPKDYTLLSQTITENLALFAYENNNLDMIQLCITPAGGEVRLDTEDAIYSEVTLYNYKAILLEENGYQVFWHDEKADVLYTVIATALTKEAILEICHTLDMHSS